MPNDTTKAIPTRRAAPPRIDVFAQLEDLSPSKPSPPPSSAPTRALANKRRPISPQTALVLVAASVIVDRFAQIRSPGTVPPGPAPAGRDN